jgi:D-alanine-D-alanine ligase
MLVGVAEIEQTVAVLFGGRSSEHEVSLRSAVYVLKQMPPKYRIIPVGISRHGEMWSLEGTFTSKDFFDITERDLAALATGEPSKSLPAGRPVQSVIMPLCRKVLATFPDTPIRVLNLEAGVFFPVLHGPNGEDGRLQGVLEMAEVAYVGCDIRASVVGIDKNIQKVMAREAGVAVAAYAVVELEEWRGNPVPVLDRVTRSIAFPCFVKPNSLGSAVGVNRANNRVELERSIEEAFAFDRKVLVEEQMEGTEVECAFLGSPTNPRITVAGEVAPEDFYSYEAKYLDADGAKLFVPARLTAPRMQELRATAAKLARIFGLEGLCRIDFWNCVKSERFVFNEINTLPGLTSISMFPKLWEYEGTNGIIWIDEVIQRALERRASLDRLNFGIRASDAP